MPKYSPRVTTHTTVRTGTAKQHLAAAKPGPQRTNGKKK